MCPRRIVGLTLAMVIAGCASQKQSFGALVNSNASNSRAQSAHSGWYLIQPPIGHGNLPNAGARLADWQVLAFFDRAAQCDEARQQGLKAYPSYVQVSESQPLDSVQMSQRLASSTLCVSADDPRINWFHLQSRRTSWK